MEEDDDAFLYGESAAPKPANGQEAEAGLKQAAALEGMPKATGQTADAGGDEGEDEEDEREDDDEEEGEEEEEEDSDSDIDIIVDSSAAEARPPPGYNQRPLQPYNKSLQMQRAPASAITSEYTPRARPGQANTAASLAATIGLSDDTQTSTPKLSYPSQQATSTQAPLTDLPEGPAPYAPSTAPQIDLDPAQHNLLVPPASVDGEPGPLIYHVDPTEMEEKPWRRPGADLTDWFNYGFDEESWRAWAAKKTDRTMERHDLQRSGDVSSFEGSNSKQHDQQPAQDGMQFGNDPMSQQMQMMQSMMAASGMSMPPDQLMAFMGMGSGGMPGMLGMGGFGNGMFAMNQQMPPMHLMQQQFHQSQFPQQQQQQPFQQQQGPGSGSGLPIRPGMNGLPERPSFNSGDAEDQPGGSEGFKEEEVTPQATDMASNGQETGVKVEDSDGSHTPTRSGAAQAAPAANARGDPQVLGHGHGHGHGGVVAGAPTGPTRGVPPKGPAADRKGNVPGNVPTGPKNPGRRYNDRDNGLGAADSLDYGGGGNGRDRSMSRGPQSPAHYRHHSNDGSQDFSSNEHSPRQARRTDEDDVHVRNRSQRHGSRSRQISDDHHAEYRRRHGVDDDRGSYSRRASESVDAHDNDEAESVASAGHGKRGSRRGGARSDRDRERSERRRGGGRGASPIDEESEHHSGRNDKDRSHARSRRRAGSPLDDIADDDDAHTAHHGGKSKRSGGGASADKGSSSGTTSSRSGGRSRKRTATDDVSPPRESRRRR